MKQLFRLPCFPVVAFAFLLPVSSNGQYSSPSSMMKFYRAHEKFFEAILEEDVKSLEQLLDDEICLDLVNGKYKTKSDFLHAIDRQQFYCDSLRYTIQQIGDFSKTGTFIGKADMIFRHQLADSTWKENVEYLTYTAKYSKPGSVVRMVSLETVHHDTGIGTCKPMKHSE